MTEPAPVPSRVSAERVEEAVEAGAEALVAMQRYPTGPHDCDRSVARGVIEAALPFLFTGQEPVREAAQGLLDVLDRHDNFPVSAVNAMERLRAALDSSPGDREANSKVAPNTSKDLERGAVERDELVREIAETLKRSKLDTDTVEAALYALRREGWPV